jgi:pimeloyl-ACP methyl ester carboxylesterase
MSRTNQQSAWLALCIVTTCAAASPAQQPDDVRFETADKAELHGTFYPSNKAKAPCVILLHKWGGNRNDAGWKELAQVLQKEYAVLSFDFRGHGDSVEVSPEFWRSAANSIIRGAARLPQKISHKDFPTAYMPVLANDVAAARRFLDRQNDAGACNSSNIIIIGAEEGAAIGGLWIASEWQRQRLIKNAFGQWALDPQGRSEGEDIASAVWLSMPRALGGIFVGFFFHGKIRDRVPMAFFYGDKDDKARAAAHAIFEDMQRAGRDKLEYTKLRAKETRLAGNDLLKPSLNTGDEIESYLTKVMEKRTVKPPVPRDPDAGPPFLLIPLRRFGYPF